MISFKNYYLQQIKDVPVIWNLAKKHKNTRLFCVQFLCCFFH